jgi:PIN domain nuclease of toxin-antitoxin system
MIAGVADTHTAIWYIFGNPRLSLRAASFINRAALAGQKIAVSAITLVELVYLVEKNRLPQAAYDELFRALSDPEHVFTEAVFTAAIVQSMRQVARAQVPDMPDRVIAATALYLNVPVISRDNRILATSLKTVW